MLMRKCDQCATVQQSATCDGWSYGLTPAMLAPRHATARKSSHPPRAETCTRCFAAIPAGRFTYCSDLCYQRASKAQFLDAHPGYQRREGREYARRNRDRINARRRELYRLRLGEVTMEPMTMEAE